MKIAIEAQRIFRANKHGMDFVALETIKQLQKLDQQNEYYILAAPGQDRSVLQESHNFHIIELSCPFYPLWEQFALPRAIKKIKPDFLHCTSNTAPLVCSVPLIITLHDIIFLEKRSQKSRSFYQNIGWYYRKLIVPKVLKKCHKIITVSNYEAENIRTTLNLDSDKVITVYNGYSEHFKKTVNYKEVTSNYIPIEPYIFFLGNTDPKKNTERVIKAYDLYHQKSLAPLPLLVADLGRNIVLSIIETHGIDPKLIDFIYTPGYIKNIDLPFIYSGATLFLYPSLRESFGIPQLEAMACGTPVIASNTSAMPEISGDAAYYVNPLDQEQIANAILELESEELRKKMIGDGYERIKLFSWLNSAKALLEIYTTIKDVKKNN